MIPNLLRLLRRRVAATWLTLLIIISFAQPARPDTVELPLDFEFSGATPPAGAAPWLTAVFDDQAGSVLLSLSADGLTDSEHVKVWYFNLDPLLDPAALVFGPPSKIGTFDDPIITTGVDLFKAAGDGLFDIEFKFANAANQGRRFEAGESMTTEITMTGGATLTVGQRLATIVSESDRLTRAINSGV